MESYKEDARFNSDAVHEPLHDPLEQWWTRAYIIDYVLVAVLAITIAVLHFAASPRDRYLSPGDPSLSYPFTAQETVPVWLLLLWSLLVPLLSFAGVLILRKYLLGHYSVRRLVFDAHHTLLAFVAAILITAIITDALKFSVGRYRPDYFSRPAEMEREGRLSFPSGHSSQSFVGLGFLAIWLAGQMRLFSAPHLWKSLVAFVPIILAMWIAASRLIDYRHHFSDVIAGSCIGLCVALVIYLMFFQSLFQLRTSGLAKIRPQTMFGLADEKREK